MYILTRFSPSTVYTSKRVYDNIYVVFILSKINFLNMECLTEA